MADFSSNDGAPARAIAQPHYAAKPGGKLKRIGLASFLCGIAACITVSLIAVATMFIYYQITAIFLPQSEASQILNGESLMSGAGMATIMAALNWYVGYITIPVAWMVLALSIGRFPRRNITRPGPYYRWGAIWGALLVGGTTGIATGLISQGNPALITGALATGLIMGGAAGFICGWLFRAIVRPAEQINRIQVDVF